MVCLLSFQVFNLRLRFIKHLYISCITKLRKEVPFHILIGLALIQLHDKPQTAGVPGGIPYRNGIDNVQYLLPARHIAVGNQSAQGIPCHADIAYLEQRGRKGGVTRNIIGQCLCTLTGKVFILLCRAVGRSRSHHKNSGNA